MTTSQPNPPQPSRPLKRRRTESTSNNTHPKQHHLRRIQTMPTATEPAPQDPTFAQSQLLRSITTALHIAGYDSVLPSALEAFRAQVEEYMLSFLSDVKTSMHSSRRADPLPQDFTYALSALGLRSSHLEPHLELALPTEIAAPLVAAPAPAEPAPLNLAPMLGAELHMPLAAGAAGTEAKGGSSYIPAHFPPLPSRHAYLSTPVFTAREKDARKIRERATEEGMLAERALRRLTAARVQKEGRNGRGGERAKAREDSWREAMGELMLKEEGKDEVMGGTLAGSAVVSFGDDGAAFGLDDVDDMGDEKDRFEAMMRSGGLSVNHDRGHWRRGAGAAVR